MRLRALWIAAWIVAPVSAAEALKCPEGAQVQRDAKPYEGKRAEWCQDQNTGRQHGPGRLVDESGTVLVTFEYREGTLASRQFTRAGLKKMLDEVNAQFSAQGDPISVTLVDEHKLRFDMTVKGKLPDGIAEFRRMALANVPICRMLASAATDFRTIDFRAANEKGEAVEKTTFTRADCEKAAGR